MKHFVTLFILVFTVSFSARAQHFSKDFPLEIPATHAASWEQSLDLTGIGLRDFAAISIVFEGENLTQSAVNCVRITPRGSEAVPAFSEEVTDGRYVSELIFVPATESRHLVFRFTLDPALYTAKIKGHIHVFSPTGVTSSLEKPEGAAAFENRTVCNCPMPSFVARTSWGVGQGLSESIFMPPAVYTSVTHLIVHHSAGTNTSSNWPGVVASIFDYHVNVNGWSDIGYNWLIAPNGTLFEGRGGGDNVQGSHMCGYNKNTMGVCALGSYINTPFPAAGIAMLQDLLTWKSCKETIAPLENSPINSYPGILANIAGHRDGCAPNYTECPGDMLYGQLIALRLAVDARIEAGCDISTGVVGADVAPELKLSPNPVGDQLQIQVSGLPFPGRISVIDALGRVVSESEAVVAETSLLLPTGQLPAGIYYVVYRANGGVTVGKFWKP